MWEKIILPRFGKMKVGSGSISTPIDFKLMHYRSFWGLT